MAIIASGSKMADGSVRIVLKNTTAFTTANWRATPMVETDFFSMPLLYSLEQSGVGSLSSDSKTLTIIIPETPITAFRLNVGTFTKVIDIRQDKYELSPTLAYIDGSPSIYEYNNTDKSPRWHGNLYENESYYFSHALLFLSGNTESAGEPGQHKAKIVENNEVVGFCFGSAFANIQGEIYAEDELWDGIYPYPGIIFNRFLWLESPPQEEKEFTVIVKYLNKDYRLKATFNSERPTGPINDQLLTDDYSAAHMESFLL